MSIQHASGNQGYNQNQDTVDETVLSTSGITAETNADGVQINLVPKEGSNIFSGSTNGLYSGKSLQSDNLSDSLRARGLLSVTSVNYVYDAGTNLGGPILQDRIWFYGAFREWGNDRGAAGKFYNKTQGTFFYTPDLSKPAFTHEWMESKALRLTTMIGSKNKINVFADNQRDCHCPALVSAGSIDAPEAFFSYRLNPAGLYQATWSAPFTSKLLAEAGVGVVHGSWPQESQPEVGPNDVSIMEQSTGIRFGNLATRRFHQHVPRRSQRGSLSYVTGSHAFKGGFQFEESTANFGVSTIGDVNYVVRDGIPVSITQWATPWFEQNRNKDWGWFVQDQWTVERLTMNYGVRFERFHGYIPAQHVDATPNGWVPARDFAAVKNVPLWKDWNPRVGAAYDLFGDGKTALKFSIGRFVAKTSVTITQSVNPIVTSINNVSRSWADTNNNRIPECDLANRQANGECGAMANLNFGGTAVTTRFADDAINGWGVRGNNWDMSAELQHQLGGGVSMTAGYYRNWFGNFIVTDNTLVTPADYSTFCITAPKDSRLPDGGGHQVCGLADVSLAKFGQVNSINTQASHFGEQKQINDFFNVTFSTRLPNGMMLGGGVDTGRSVTDNCFVGRFTAAAGQLPPGDRAGGEHAVQGVRQLQPAVQLLRERGVPEHRGPADHGELCGQQRGDRAVARAQPGSVRHARSLHVHRHRAAHHARHDVRRPHDPARPAAGQAHPAVARGSGSRATSTSTTCSTAPPSTCSTPTTARGGCEPSRIQDGRMLQFSASVTY